MIFKSLHKLKADTRITSIVTKAKIRSSKIKTKITKITVFRS